MGVPLKGTMGSEGCQYFCSMQMVCECIGSASQEGWACVLRQRSSTRDRSRHTLTERGASGTQELRSKLSKQEACRGCWLRLDVQTHLPPVLGLSPYGHSELTDPRHAHGSGPQSSSGDEGWGEVVLMGRRWCRQEMTNTAQRKNLHKSNWIYIN